jgi:hypothetical protein
MNNGYIRAVEKAPQLPFFDQLLVFPLALSADSSFVVPPNPKKYSACPPSVWRVNPV